MRRLEKLQRSEPEEEERPAKRLNKRKQEIWDNQFLIHHGRLAEVKGSYEAGFIINEILGPRPETPLLDDIASAEQLQALERERMRTDAVLSNWKTPPGSPWEPSEDATFDTSSLSWDTEDIAPQDEATVPEAWDEGEEEASRTSASEVWTTAGEEEDDSLPELVSGSEDSGYEFLNTPKNEEHGNKAEEEPNRDTSEKVKTDKRKKYDIDEQEEL